MASAVLLVVATQLCAGQLCGSEYVVAPSGDDRNPGTAEQPFATIQRAQAAARRDIAAGLDSDLVIELRGGRYEIQDPLVFDERDSGTARHRVLYTAAKGQSPVISGGRKIGEWKRADDGILEVPAGELHSRELFVNGQRRPRARHPNQGFFRAHEVGADRRTSFTAEPGDLDGLGDLGGAELVFLHDWNISRIPIKSSDFATRRVTTASPVGYSPPFGAMDYFEQDPRYAIENAPAALDAPGEWYLDLARGVIQYRPFPGESPATMTAIVPVVGRLVIVRGPAHPAPRVRNLHFHGLRFEHCAWRPPSAGYASSQATWHERRSEATGGMAPIPTAIVVDRAQDCSFTACRLEHLGGSGLWLRRDCRHNRIEGNHLVNIGGNGLMIGEAGADRDDQFNAENHVINNLVERCGQHYFGAVGVWIGIARGTRIEHNLIRHLPYTGVSLGWRWDADRSGAESNIVAHNHIYRVMQTLSDGGAIYTLGQQPNSYLRGNRIHDLPLNLGKAESNGIFMDEGSTGFTVENNLVYATACSPIRFHRATQNLLRNNVLGTAQGKPMFRYIDTDEEWITKRGNRLMHEATPSVDDLARVATAGLQPAFRAALLPTGRHE